LPECGDVFLNNCIRPRSAFAEASPDDLKPAVPFIYHDIDAAKRNSFAFSQLRTTARHATQFSERLSQRIFVFLASLERTQRLVEEDVKEVLMPISSDMCEITHHLLTTIERFRLLGHCIFVECEGR